MEGCCSFKAIVGGVCGCNPKDRTRNSEIVPIFSCKKDIDSHKSTYKFTRPEDKAELILCRAAKFSKSEIFAHHDDLSEPSFQTWLRLE